MIHPSAQHVAVIYRDGEGREQTVLIPLWLLNQFGSDHGHVALAFTHLTGLTPNHIVAYDRRVIVDAQGKRRPAAKKPIIIHATAYSDDTVGIVVFDAAPYCEQASDEDLSIVSREGNDGGYASRFVAEWTKGRDPFLEILFAYLEKHHQGFSCSLDEGELLAWIKQHRPALFQRLEEEDPHGKTE